MKLAIMQPYFFPYIGYFQLLNAVDEFVIYDNIEYTKKGWINRNRYLRNGSDAYFTLPLKKDSDYLNIDERYLSQNFDKYKLLNQIKSAYHRAPYFDITYNVFKQIIMTDETNLFNFVRNSITILAKHLGIETNIVISSTIEVDHSLKGKDKVIAICKALNSDTYFNPIGGLELYSKEEFAENNVYLKFIRSNDLSYPQLDNEFVPWLSTLDVLMFNSQDEINDMLTEYSLV